MANRHSGFVLPTGNAIQTALVAGNTALFQAYDVNSTTYRTLITMTANNDVTLDLAFLNSISAVANIDIGSFDLKALTLTSDVATGTAPLTVASITLVTNLNAEHWNDKHLGAVTDGKLVRYNSTGTQLETGTVAESSGALSLITTLGMGGDLTNYEVLNDGSPEFRLGSADAEELHIQSVYDAGAQTLSHILFQTDVASATADKGQFKFNVDGTEIFRIDDGGIEVVGTVTIGTAFILTGGTNTFNLTNGSAIIDVASSSTLDVNANLTVESASAINQDLTSDASPTFAGLALGTGSLTMTGSLGATGARLTKGWFTDLEVTNLIVGGVTGTAATVTGAAQAAITSLGTLTTLTVDDITINGNTISSAGASSLAITPTAGQAILLDGTISIDAGVVTGATSITSTSFVGALTGNASTVTGLTFVAGKTLTVNNILTLAGTDGQTFTFPATSDTVACLGKNNNFSVTQYIGDTANADMTLGLTINQGAADDVIFALKSSDVAHGVTTVSETDTYLDIRKIYAASGGLSMTAFGGTDIGIFLRSYVTADVTAKTTAALANICLVARRASGTGATDHGADANLVVILNNSTTRFIFDAEGSAHADVEWTTFDEYDDLALLSDFETGILVHQDKIKDGFVDFMKYNKNKLEEAKIVHFDDGNPGHAMVNFTKLSMLLVGAIGQMSKKMQLYEQKFNLLGGG